MNNAERQAFRDRLYPVGARKAFHQGRHVIVEGVIVDNDRVMLGLRLDDGSTVRRYDHDVFDPELEVEQ